MRLDELTWKPCGSSWEYSLICVNGDSEGDYATLFRNEGTYEVHYKGFDYLGLASIAAQHTSALTRGITPWQHNSIYPSSTSYIPRPRCRSPISG
jgi:hypothetical protein